MHIHIYVLIHMCIYTYIYIHTYIHIHIYIYIYVFACMYVYIYIYIHVIWIDEYIDICIYVMRAGWRGCGEGPRCRAVLGEGKVRGMWYSLVM